MRKVSSIVFVVAIMSCNALARGSDGVPCLCSIIPTNETYFLISNCGDTPNAVSNNIRKLPFLSPRQISDAWKLYSAPFPEEAPHNALIRVNRETGLFDYSASFLAAKDLSCMSEVPLESISIFFVTQLVSVAGPDYSSLKMFYIGYAYPITNLSALTTASQLEEFMIHETPVTSLDFVANMTNLSTLAVQGAPISDFSPVERMLRKVSPKRTNELVVSLRYTLGDDFECLERIARDKPNVRIAGERERLPLSFVQSYDWDKILSKELLSLCEQDEEE
jgi:hypothetical protein